MRNDIRNKIYIEKDIKKSNNINKHQITLRSEAELELFMREENVKIASYIDQQ